MFVGLVGAAALLVALCGAGAAPASAEGLVDHAHSLRTVPSDVAFYSASLRLKEQLDIFLASNAYRRLMEIPIVQMGKMQAMFQFQQSREPVVARFRDYFNSAEGQEAFALLKEMFTHEIFVYGDKNMATVLALLMEINGLNRAAKVEALASGEEEEEVMARRVLEFFNENAEQLVIPNLVWGFRLHDGARVTKHLDRIQEVLAGALEEEYPDLVEQVTREQIAGNEFVVMRLNGAMIPWDQLREEAEDIDDEQFAQWQEVLSKKSAALALGVVGEFVLMSLGESTDHLAKLGDGPSLADQPAVVRLAKHAGQRVTSIAYVSKAFAESMSSPRRQVDDMVLVAEEGLDELEVNEETRAQLMEDIRGFGQDMLRYLPEPGDVAAISFLTPRGYESFQYQTGTRPLEDSSEPLTLLEHAGGSPMLLIASRSDESIEDYDRIVTWLKRIGTQLEQIAKDKAHPDDWADYLAVRDRGIALLTRLDETNRKHLIPALADGQQAFVMDAAAKSKQWINLMPRSPEPLPMLELGMVASVSDAELMRQGMVELSDITQETIDLLHEINPDKVPEFQLPEPKEKSLPDGGTVVTYPLPPAWGIDKQLVPNAALTDDVAVTSLTPELTERLVRNVQPKLDTSLDFNRPAAMVTYLDCSRFVDAIRPWVEYGGAIAMGQISVDIDVEEDGEEVEVDEEFEDDAPTQEEAQRMMMAGMVLPQIHQFLDVASAMRTFSGVVYREDDAWVTHSEAHFKDID
jgi:hypothetical protein